MALPFRLMGVVNVTPDSFSDGGLFLQTAAAVEHGLSLIAQGADIVDVGGESTRPGAEPVSVEDELRRVLGVVEGLATAGTTVQLSIDTSKAAVNSFTIHLAHELKGTKIKVNSAHPGWVKTDMGTDAAPMELVDGAKTSVWLSMLPESGPTGGYFHMQEAITW